MPQLTAHDLLSRGYFPKELPPPFDPLDFANRVVASVGPVPVSLSSKKLRARPCIHNIARVGSLRRRLSICNPIAFYNLALAIEKAWPRLERIAKDSPFSQSRPAPTATRAVSPTGQPLPSLRASHRATSRFLLKADVARFYHSIYTHSIPWAIHGKDTAKRNRKDRLIGNLIDTWVRNGQDGQTMGIPIGPDTSLIIAEVVLSAIDKQIHRKQPRVRGFRWFDDYELNTSSRDHAEVALGALQEALGGYEIALNSEKTAITELPCELEQQWV